MILFLVLGGVAGMLELGGLFLYLDPSTRAHLPVFQARRLFVRALPVLRCRRSERLFRVLTGTVLHRRMFDVQALSRSVPSCRVCSTLSTLRGMVNGGSGDVGGLLARMSLRRLRVGIGSVVGFPGPQLSLLCFLPCTFH